MNFTAFHASLAVFNGIFAIVLMILGSINNDMVQAITGIIGAIISTIGTYLAIKERDE